MTLHKEYYHGRNQLPQITEVTIPVWFGDGWVATEVKPYLFRLLVRYEPGTKYNMESYTVDSVDYLDEQPLDVMIPQFIRTIPKLREMVRVSLSYVLDIPLDSINMLKKSVLWCAKEYIT